MRSDHALAQRLPLQFPKINNLSNRLLEITDYTLGWGGATMGAYCGAGKFEHFYDEYVNSKPSALGAANIFHFTEQSVKNAKKFLSEKGLNIRK